MALENLTPVTRREAILSGIPLEPVTREEYFLEEAVGGGGLPEYTSADEGKVLGLAEDGEAVAPAWVNGGGGGGSDLPEYSASDIGKSLQVVEDAEHSTTVTIVPEQSVTLTRPPVVLSNVNEEYFTSEYIGKTAVLAYDNTTVNLTCISESGTIWYVDDPTGDNVTYFVQLNDGDVIFMHIDTGTHTISLTMQVPEPALSWQTPENQFYYVEMVDYTLNKTWQEIFNAVKSGKTVILGSPTETHISRDVLIFIGIEDGFYRLGFIMEGAPYSTNSADGYPVYTD